jgi:hypothetical protein
MPYDLYEESKVELIEVWNRKVVARGWKSGLVEEEGVVVCLFKIFETRSHYVAQAGLELAIFLFLPPECCNHRHVPTHQA